MYSQVFALSPDPCGLGQVRVEGEGAQYHPIHNHKFPKGELPTHKSA